MMMRISWLPAVTMLYVPAKVVAISAPKMAWLLRAPSMQWCETYVEEAASDGSRVGFSESTAIPHQERAVDASVNRYSVGERMINVIIVLVLATSVLGPMLTRRVGLRLKDSQAQQA